MSQALCWAGDVVKWKVPCPLRGGRQRRKSVQRWDRMETGRA